MSLRGGGDDCLPTCARAAGTSTRQPLTQRASFKTGSARASVCKGPSCRALQAGWTYCSSRRSKRAWPALPCLPSLDDCAGLILYRCGRALEAGPWGNVLWGLIYHQNVRSACSLRLCSSTNSNLLSKCHESAIPPSLSGPPRPPAPAAGQSIQQPCPRMLPHSGSRWCHSQEA